MTPYDLVPFLLFGTLYLGARKLDQKQCKTFSTSPSPSSSSWSLASTYGDAKGSVRRETTSMPSFMRDYEARP